ncbi:MAG: CBS domain-containing protein [Spirochaetales bacterium]|nr:CBS domain-containing protein [Spirochaetales bacterium]
MKKKISKILSINLLPPILSFGMLSAYVFLYFIPELELISKSGGDTAKLVKTLLPYTLGVLLVTAAIFVFSAVHNLRTELSRERLKKLYNIMDEEYQSWVETTADGFIYINEMSCMNANKIVLSMLDYQADEFQILRAEDIINKDSDGTELLEYISTRDDDITGRYETRLIRKDRTFAEVLISASRISTPLMDGFILIVKDMSDKARTEALRIDVQREYSIVDFQSALQYLYQNAGSMMVEPLLFDEQTEILQAVERMNVEHKNTFIVIDREGFASGIVTDQDLRQRVISGEVGTSDPVSRIMSSPVVTAEPGIMFFEAFRKMREHSIRQLVITDGEGKPAGVLTEKKLIQIQSTNSAVLFEELKRADTIPKLRDCYRQLTFSVRTLVLSGAKAANITGVVSKTAEIITQKLIEMAFLKFGPAPCEFAYLAMGSEGRGEQTLITDQDNGIIFSDVPEEKIEICRSYFLRLGKYVSDSLDNIGYAYCKGGVMASNAKWVRSETEWRDQFRSWVTGTASGKMLDVNIIFDFKCVYGDKKLSRALRLELWDTINRFPSYLREMAATVSEFKPPLTPFGRIQVKYTEHDDEVFDIKKALSPLIIYARTLALREKIEETATSARLRVLKEKGVITPNQFRSYEHAFEYLTLLRFGDQIQTIEEGEPLDNLIYIEDLMEVEILTLRKIFKQISRAQDDLRFTFTGTLR